MNKLLSPLEIEQLELNLFLDTLCEVYGLDLKNNSQASLRRRLNSLVKNYKKERISELIPLILYNENFNDKVIGHITVQFSNLFRDPLFFKKLIKKIFPKFKDLSHINIWIAGCANGEEVYSLLILLKEAEFLDRVTLYATDISKDALTNAKSGILQKGIEKKDIDNYNLAGGKASLSDYFVVAYSKFKLKEELLSHVIFKEHDLAQDEAFIATELILCRNVMIYFSHQLQEKVLQLLNSSLVTHGYLGIGMQESLAFLESAKGYKALKKDISIYKKDF